MATAEVLLHTVYVAYSARDEAFAAELRRKLADDGITTQSLDQDADDENPWLAVRDAIAECELMVVLATENYICSTNLVYEFGIASAWQKPVYVVTKDVLRSALPE